MCQGFGVSEQKICPLLVNTTPMRRSKVDTHFLIERTQRLENVVLNAAVPIGLWVVNILS